MIHGSLTGRRFGLLLVEGSNGADRYTCRCDCGMRTSVAGTNLRNGRSTSCGNHRRHQAMLGQIVGYRTIQPTRPMT